MMPCPLMTVTVTITPTDGSNCRHHLLLFRNVYRGDYRMKALVDSDILRYEIGWGAVTAWRGMHEGVDPETIGEPPWWLVESILEGKLEEILFETKSDSYQLYLTEGETFRFALAKTKPYKGTRKENKPWHFANLTSHMTHILGAIVVRHIEADDQLALDHLNEAEETILCSRDKDLRQVPGYFYSWELGRQPSFGPLLITDPGSLTFKNGKLKGSGFAFFCAQVLMGDPTDNILGLKGWGPVATYNHLSVCVDRDDLLDRVEEAYSEHHKGDWEEYLLEQGRLCWITRRLHEDGTPVLWELGMVK